MKKYKNSGIDNDLSYLPDNLIKLIKMSLEAKNFTKKINARSSLIKLGKTIIPQMHKLTESENVMLRMEAAKIVELIADKRSIPVLINLLDDEEFEIRWIAAEGLIKIGRRSIRPLLNSVSDGKCSFLQSKGVHHVLENLLYQSEKKKLMSLLLSLDNYHGLGGSASAEASVALRTVFKVKD